MSSCLRLLRLLLGRLGYLRWLRLRWQPYWRQRLLDLRALRLEPRRQLQTRAQQLRRLVDGETRQVRGDLEEHATRLTEVDRVEILAVLHRRHAQPLAGKL